MAFNINPMEVTLGGDIGWGGFKSSARFQIDDEQFRFIPVINKAV